MKSYSQRAPFNDWWYWSECLVKRFRVIADIYKDNEDRTRAADATAWADKLKKNCGDVVAEMRKHGAKPNDEQKAKLKPLEEEAIFQAATMFREVLVNLPFISQHMQEYIGYTWQETKWQDASNPEKPELDENGLPIAKKKKRAPESRISELFWGPAARQDEGIRSGKVEDGGLPGILYNMVMAEKTSSNRAPTDYGQAMQASAAQAGVATNKWTAVNSHMQFKPSGGI